MVASRELDSRHLGNAEGDRLTLGGHEDNLLVDLDASLVAEETGNHELRTVADRIDSGILNDDSLVPSEERLQWADDAAEVGLVAVIVQSPLSVHDIVESDDTVVLTHGTRAHTAELLHVSTNAQQKTKMNTECSDVGTSLAANPEDTKVALVVEFEELELVNSSHTELTLDGRDQWGALEESTSQGLHGASKLGLRLDLVVKAEHADVLLSGTLLGLDETGGAVNADNQASGDLRIEGTRVSGLLTTSGKSAIDPQVDGMCDEDIPKNSLHPSDDLMGRWVAGLVKVDNTTADVTLDVALQRGSAARNGSEVSSANKKFIIVLQEEAEANVSMKIPSARTATFFRGGPGLRELRVVN